MCGTLDQVQLDWGSVPLWFLVFAVFVMAAVFLTATTKLSKWSIIVAREIQELAAAMKALGRSVAQSSVVPAQPPLSMSAAEELAPQRLSTATGGELNTQMRVSADRSDPPKDHRLSDVVVNAARFHLLAAGPELVTDRVDVATQATMRDLWPELARQAPAIVAEVEKQDLNADQLHYVVTRRQQIADTLMQLGVSRQGVADPVQVGSAVDRAQSDEGGALGLVVRVAYLALDIASVGAVSAGAGALAGALVWESPAREATKALVAGTIVAAAAELLIALRAQRVGSMTDHQEMSSPADLSDRAHSPAVVPPPSATRATPGRGSQYTGTVDPELGQGRPGSATRHSPGRRHDDPGRLPGMGPGSR